MEMVKDFVFSGSKITVDSNCTMEVCSLEEKLDSVLKNRDITLMTKDDKGPHSQSYSFPSNHVQM